MNEHYIKNIDENDLFDQFIEYCKLFKKEVKTDKREKIKKTNPNIIDNGIGIKTQYQSHSIILVSFNITKINVNKSK